MPLSDAYASNTAQYTIIRILTVDRQNRAIDGVLKDSGKIKVGIFDPGSAFRWPKVDEFWTVKRNGYDWELVGRVRPGYETTLDELEPGELVLDADVIRGAQGKRLLNEDDLDPEETRDTVAVPPAAVDGQRWNFVADNTLGIVWSFRYDSGRWECVGGSHLFIPVNALATITAGGATSQGFALNTPPQYTTPWEGGWEIEHGCEASVSGGGLAVQNVVLGGSFVSNDLIETGSTSFATMSRRIGAKVVVEGASIYLSNWITLGGTGSWSRRWLALKPTFIVP